MLSGVRPRPVKIVLAGGFGVGKTTAVSQISEIPVLTTTEAVVTDEGDTADQPATVELHFGRLTIDDEIVLYLFGTPGQDRFGLVWDELTDGALGGLVVVDTRRLEDCRPAIDCFRRSGLPFVVAVNRFDGAQTYSVGGLRSMLGVSADTPVVTIDARQRSSVRDALVAVLQEAKAKALAHY